MKRILLLLACCFSFLAHAQQYEVKEGRIKLGLNYGAAWQKSDVRAVLGWGTGLTLEYAFLQNNKSPFGLSLRGRYLFTSTRGIDKVSRFGLDNNTVLNGTDGGLDYTGDSKFYHNHKTFANNWDLELMLHFNKLRARHNLILYLFGGLGTMGYNANLDQKDAFDQKYDYTDIGTGIQSTPFDLRAKRDGKYETAAQNNGRPSWVFAPSLGIGFGFRLSPVFSMIFEHKVTFPKTDLLDGQQWNADNTKSTTNDIHHYANMGLRFSMFGGRGRGRSTIYSGETNPPPSIIINEPSVYPATAPNCNAELIFTVTNITSRDQVEVRLNGRLLAQSEYSMDYTSHQFRVNKNLTGESVFEIRATNANGSDNESVQFGCSPTIYPPIISLVEPSSPIITGCSAAFKVAVKNVSSKDQIEVRQNGQVVSTASYEFNASSGVLTFYSVQLTVNATFYIKASNSAGSASLEIKFNCSNNRVIPAPEVVIITPGSNPYNSASCNENITAQLYNVKATDKIQVVVNNTALRTTQYVYNASTGMLTFSLPIARTANIVITATTTGGSASDGVVINCTPNIPPPTVKPPSVTIATPSSNPYVSTSCNEQIVAFAQNVPDKAGVRIFVNNVQLSPTLFTYNSANGEIRFTTKISQTALISIKVSNADGSASDEVQINCKPVIQETPRPSVTITTPFTDSYVSTTCSELIVAETRNVNRKEEIRISANGTALASTDFTFDVATQRIQLTRKFNGKVLIVITISNAGGTAADQVELVCQPPIESAPAPGVVITSPSSEVFVSTTCREKIIANVTNVKSKTEVFVWVGARALSQAEFTLSPDMKTVSLEPRIASGNEIRIRVTNAGGSAEDRVTINCVSPPQVVINTPATETFNSTDCRELVVASIVNVSAVNQVSVYTNGLKVDPSMYEVDLDAKLVKMNHVFQGTSTLKIVATNQAGTANDQVVLSCTPIVVPKPLPVIELINPVSKAANQEVCSGNCSFGVKANIQYVTEASGIKVYLNGKALSSNQYSFMSNSGLFAMNQATVLGSTDIIKIEARNDNGVATEQITLTCAKLAETPIITITSPGTAEASSQTCTLNVVAKIKNVASDKIRVYSNNLLLSSGQYTWNESTKELSVSLLESATLKIEGSNECGSASDEVKFRCLPPAPTVTITNPSSSPYTSVTCEETVKATVMNVTGKDQIAVKINGQTIGDELYSFNAATHVVDVKSIIETNTTVEIVATNESGTASDKVVMNCKPKANPPLVTISSPSSTPYTSVDCQETVKALVSNVSGKEQIVVKINGQEISDALYSYNAGTKIVEIETKVEANTSVEIIATNESGSASDKVLMNCKPKGGDVEVPSFPEGNTCPSSSPSKYIDCETCHSSDDGVTSITVEEGKKVCIKNTFTGQITMRGGTLVICGTARPSSLNFSSGTIVINGEAAFGSLNLNNNDCTVRNFGKLTLQGTTFNGRMENYGTMNVGSDCNVNSNGVFKNTGTLTVNGSMNNSKFICNSGTMNINGSMHNNGNATFINSCKVIIASEFHNNGTFENSAYVKVGTKAIINGGSDFVMSGGSRLVTNNFDFNGSISGSGSGCASISVSGQTTINGGASLTGNVSLCDANGIEQNNTGSKITSTCNCKITETSCTPGLTPVVDTPKEEEEKDELVEICHKPPGNPDNCQTLKVPRSALRAHLAHGDHEGACTPAELNKIKDKEEAEKKRQEQEEAEKKRKEEEEERERKEKEEAEKQNELVEICHKPPGNPDNCQTLKVPRSALKAHLAHGDHEGACTPAELNKIKDKEEAEKKRQEQEEAEKKRKEEEEERERKEKEEAEKQNELVEICHKPPGNPDNCQTLKVPRSALKAHLDHGDHEGACTPAELNKVKEKEEAEKKRQEQEEAERKRKEQEEQAEKERKEKEEAEKQNELVEICHKPPGNPDNCQTLKVPRSALKAHLDHGDHEGACTPAELNKMKEKEEAEKRRKEQEEAERVEKERKEKEEQAERERKEKEEQEKQNELVEICHKPPGNPDNCQTLKVPRSALNAHLAHGDHEGPCTDAEFNRKKQKEEEDRQRKEQEEADRVQKEQEQQRQREEREKQLREEADRKRKELDELNRQKREKEEAEKQNQQQNKENENKQEDKPEGKSNNELKSTSPQRTTTQPKVVPPVKQKPEEKEKPASEEKKKPVIPGGGNTKPTIPGRPKIN